MLNQHKIFVLAWLTILFSVRAQPPSDLVNLASSTEVRALALAKPWEGKQTSEILKSGRLIASNDVPLKRELNGFNYYTKYHVEMEGETNVLKCQGEFVMSVSHKGTRGAFTELWFGADNRASLFSERGTGLTENIQVTFHPSGAVRQYRSYDGVNPIGLQFDMDENGKATFYTNYLTKQLWGD